MHINDFSYKLPESKIALFPPKERGNSQLLVFNKQTRSIKHDKYSNFSEYISSGDVVVLNDTKVIKARLLAHNKAKTREFLLLERHTKKLNHHEWKVLYRGKITIGEVYKIKSHEILIKQILDDGMAEISSTDDLLKVCSKYGVVPLPPYMHRQSTEEDISRYQTEFASSLGSVAAPTASLNFTSQLIKQIQDKGGVVSFITLHVGLGTFLPIRTEVIEQHKMHSEYFEVPAKTIKLINKAKTRGNRIFAVGTTVTRTLEYLYKTEAPKEKDYSGEADIFIYPGYKFKVVDAMLTNFHAPKSTVLMMASAFAGWENLQHTYQVAIDNNYRFLSYGDSMLII